MPSSTRQLARALRIAGCLLLPFPLPRFALADLPRIQEVRIEGVRLLSEGALRRDLETRSGAPLDSTALRRDVDRLLSRCQAAGLYLAEIEYPEVRSRGRGAVIVFRMREGPQARVGRLTIDDPDSALLAATMSTRPGRGFRPGVLEADVEAILRRYERSGYPFCSVSPRLEALSREGRVDLALAIDRGPVARFGELRITGNRSTRASVIRRLAGIRAGELYDQDQVDRARQALLRSGWFDTVSEATPARPSSAGISDVSLQVTERKTNRIDGVVGYVPDAGGQGGYVAGLLNLDLQNLTGTGRKAYVRWERKGPSSSDLRIGFEEPWVGPTPASGRLGFSQLQRPGYSVTEVRVDLGLPSPGGWAARFGSAWSLASPDSAGLGLLARSQSWSGSGGLSADTRDDPDNPRSGGWLSLSATFGRTLRSLAAGSETHLRLRGEGEWLVPTFARQALSVTAHAEGISGWEGNPPIHEKIRLGGGSSLRGYREEQFAGVAAAWGGAEYRFLTGRRSRAFLFLDAGWIRDRRMAGDRSVSPALFRVGYGAGIRAESGAGILGLDLGVGQGGGVSQAQIHVRWAHRF